MYNAGKHTHTHTHTCPHFTAGTTSFSTALKLHHVANGLLAASSTPSRLSHVSPTHTKTPTRTHTSAVLVLVVTKGSAKTLARLSPKQPR